jgi:hypothetical protein
LTYDVGPEGDKGGVMALPKAAVTLVPLGQQKNYEIYPGMPDDHDLEISAANQDTGHWFCKSQRFKVLQVHPRDGDPVGPYPFYREFPGANPSLAYEVNTGPAKPEAKGFWYKATFQFEDGTILDPHIRIT